MPHNAVCIHVYIHRAALQCATRLWVWARRDTVSCAVGSLGLGVGLHRVAPLCCAASQGCERALCRTQTFLACLPACLQEMHNSDWVNAAGRYMGLAMQSAGRGMGKDERDVSGWAHGAGVVPAPPPRCRALPPPGIATPLRAGPSSQPSPMQLCMHACIHAAAGPQPGLRSFATAWHAMARLVVLLVARLPACTCCCPSPPPRPGPGPAPPPLQVLYNHYRALPNGLFDLVGLLREGMRGAQQAGDGRLGRQLSLAVRPEGGRVGGGEGGWEGGREGGAACGGPGLPVPPLRPTRPQLSAARIGASAASCVHA